MKENLHNGHLFVKKKKNKHVQLLIFAATGSLEPSNCFCERERETMFNFIIRKDSTLGHRNINIYAKDVSPID